MKKVYYLCHCGSGTSVHQELLELVKEEGDKLIFHIKAWDWDKHESRVITLKAFRKQRRNYYGELANYIEFKSSKEQFKYSFIREENIPDDQEPEKHKITQ